MAQTLVSPSRPKSGPRVAKRAAKPPVLKTTQYDLVSAVMIAAFIGLVLLTLWVTALWLANRRIKTDNDVPVEMLNLGGYEDGAPDETLKVESPEDPSDDPAVVDTQTEQNEVKETIENVITDSARTAQQVPQQSDLASENSGKLGSREGTGRRPLGSGGGEGNFGQRWFIRFGDEGTLDLYAEQLDSFKIKLGLLQNKRIYVLSGLSRQSVTPTVYTSGASLKNQHYFTWAGGGRKKADIKLFKQKANLDASRGIIFHFYTPQTIQVLAQLEKSKSEQPVNKIQRTYFIVLKKGNGYEFAITKIVYK
jgi:hypothetical protein